MYGFHLAFKFSVCIYLTGSPAWGEQTNFFIDLANKTFFDLIDIY